MVARRPQRRRRSVQDVSRAQIAARQQTIGPNDTAAPRQAREGGKRPQMQASGHYGRVWLAGSFCASAISTSCSGRSTTRW